MHASPRPWEWEVRFTNGNDEWVSDPVVLRAIICPYGHERGRPYGQIGMDDRRDVWCSLPTHSCIGLSRKRATIEKKILDRSHEQPAGLFPPLTCAPLHIE